MENIAWERNPTNEMRNPRFHIFRIDKAPIANICMSMNDYACDYDYEYD